MDANRLYSYLIDMDWLFLIAYSLLVAGAGLVLFAGDLWPPPSHRDSPQASAL